MRRVCQFVESGVHPERIFVVTFNRTAAHDLRHQLKVQDVPGVETVRASTLHSFYFKTLSRTSVLEITGRVPRPLAKFEQRILTHDLKKAGSRPVRKCQELIRAFEANWARLQSDEPGWPHNSEDQEFHNELMEWLKLHQCMLLGELGNEMRAYLRSNPTSPERRQFDYILVDEYQDLNRADQTIIDMMAQTGSLMVIGDEDQSIYATLRYAQPEGIRNFRDSHPGAQDLALTICRRCPTTVVEMANSLIRFNGHREPRTLDPHPDKCEGAVRIVQYQTMEEEAVGVSTLIRTYMGQTKTTPEEVLVLVPRRIPAELIRKSLADVGVKSRSYFFDDALQSVAAQEAFSLLTLLADPLDRVAMRCWLGLRHHDLAIASYRRLLERCERHEVDILDGLEDLETLSPRPAWSNVLVERYTAWKDLRREGGGLTGSALIDFVFPESSEELALVRRLALHCLDVAKSEVDARTLVDDLREELNYPEPPSDADCVRVMSPFKAKGLTAKLVVVAGCVEGWLPTIDDHLAGAAAVRQEEEQRRLFYVAITRCTDAMVISSFDQMPSNEAYNLRLRPRYHAGGRAFGLASRFLTQLGPSAPIPLQG
jgi:superfamily I DNA/RNA helicase